MCKVLEGIESKQLSEGLNSICGIHVTSLKQVSVFKNRDLHAELVVPVLGNVLCTRTERLSLLKLFAYYILW